MRFRFIHAADIHLGYEQYNLPARADDFARAHFGMVEHAVSVGADFVLIAGDLFHRANADAWTLKQATHGLNLLRQAKIPVVAIEGNHDAQHYRKNLSWLEYLCDQDLPMGYVHSYRLTWRRDVAPGSIWQAHGSMASSTTAR
jgi:DNA repair exonuclease SbcCD nuclease subunit